MMNVLSMRRRVLNLEHRRQQSGGIKIVFVDDPSEVQTMGYQNATPFSPENVIVIVDDLRPDKEALVTD